MAGKSRALLQAEKTIAAQAAELTEAREQLKREQSSRQEIMLQRSAALDRAERAEKARDAVVDQNDMLRDRLHQAERDKAFLEGQLARVHEFDPISDRDRYEDNFPRREVKHEESRIDFYEGRPMSSERRREWYHRERA